MISDQQDIHDDKLEREREFTLATVEWDGMGQVTYQKERERKSGVGGCVSYSGRDRVRGRQVDVTSLRDVPLRLCYVGTVCVCTFVKVNK